MGIDKNISGPFVEVYEKLIITKSGIRGQWTEATVLHLQDTPSPIEHSRWLRN